MSTALVLENAYANGLRSIEALPAITASLPSLFEEPLITSSYANNSFSSIAELLKNEGYKTSFFHGGKEAPWDSMNLVKKLILRPIMAKKNTITVPTMTTAGAFMTNPFFSFLLKH